MKSLPKLTLLSLLYFTAFDATATAEEINNEAQQQISGGMQELVKYIKNWGEYAGYDVNQTPEDAKQGITLGNTLINITTTQLAQVSLFYSYLGAIPVNSFVAQFLPTDMINSNLLNPYANATFQGDNNALTSIGVGVNELIDQSNRATQANQSTQTPDPVTQAVMNIVGTPDSSYCIEYNGKSLLENCPYLTSALVSDKIIGTVPDAETFFSFNYIQQFLSQLNSNSLTAPLLYDQNPQQGTQGTQDGLTAGNQAQQAANFIRYVSGSVAPIKLPNWKQYDTLYAQSSNSATVTPMQQRQAQDQLSRYLANLRTYAAQSSVGMSNLYSILSKRIPQTPKEPITNYVQTSNTKASSEALNEFNMATWRIFNPPASSSTASDTPKKPDDTQWINQLNKASPATVEKEIATLLAEMNYQLYLNRQVQERLLLTNTVILLQILRQAAPSGDFSLPAQQ